MPADHDRLLQAVLDASPTAQIWVADDGTITRANRAATALLGYGNGDWGGITVEDLVPEAARERHALHRRYFHAAPETRPMGEGRPLAARRRDGSEVPVEITLTPLGADLGGGVICALTDRSAAGKLETQLRIQAQQLKLSKDHLAEADARDGLTGLRNRTALFDSLEARIALTQRSGRPLSLVLVDVDHFKPFCDAHGPRAGDQALRQIGAALRTTARRSDVVARYGGDRFAVLLPDTGAAGALELAERFRRALRFEDWAYAPLTASYGVATLGEPAPLDREARPEQIAASFLERACEALVKAKASGRDAAVPATPETPSAT